MQVVFLFGSSLNEDSVQDLSGPGATSELLGSLVVA